MARLLALPAETGVAWMDSVLLVSNLNAAAVREALRARGGIDAQHVSVVGPLELGKIIDAHAQLRAAMPSVLGLRDLEPLIEAGLRARSTLDVEQAQTLARVFWPTRAYERAREVLQRHRFAVLTGPPEMGKTAIARMIALAQMTAGWEAYECDHPEQIWRVLAPGRRQLFVADDAFGSTEYRPDAAERWARALGRLLPSLDAQHWLIWTSRPAPLKAGLRRVHLQEGAERFPAPGEVLVDAGDLDLAEKTLILFRHAKDCDASAAARRVLRATALAVVEHPHFTPERVRRLAGDRIEALSELLVGASMWRVQAAIEHELSQPTEAMRASFRALEDEHRDLLIALLDAPAGLIDARELAGIIRRHHAGGLSRPPDQLIDRLTDHFVRVTSLGIGWVHPSWRDLVIDELHEQPVLRRRFLRACGVQGAMLALSTEGGQTGERSLPLLAADEDWDTLTDRIRELLRALEDGDVARLLLAVRDALTAAIGEAPRREAAGLAGYLLASTARSWDAGRRALPAFLLDAWYELRALTAEPVDPPQLSVTWADRYPAAPAAGSLEREELVRTEEWLSLADTLGRHDPDALESLGFFSARTQGLLRELIDAVTHIGDPDLRAYGVDILGRLTDFGYAWPHGERTLLWPPDEDKWWAPQDIAAPPSREPAGRAIVEFTREDVSRVLSDL